METSINHKDNSPLQSIESHQIHNYGPHSFDYSQRCYIMGVINVTPDSFSDGGKFNDPGAAIEYGLKLLEDGADILDIGGESTRPGSDRISLKEEMSRVLPVIEGILEHKDAVISIDTYKSDVAKEALERGAKIVNDISALRFDPDMVSVVEKYNASVILMHMKGEPKTMQENPFYEDVVDDVKNFLKDRISFALDAGIKQIIVDPGFGFGKRLIDNLELLRRFDEFIGLRCPLLAGTSRKSFIGTVLDLPVDERFEGTAATIAVAVLKGARIVRVHDVKEMKRVVSMVEAVMQGAAYQKN